MAQNLANFDAALKIDYLPVIREQLENMNVLWKYLTKNADDISVVGKKATLAVHSARSTGVGSAADGGSLPTAANQAFVNSDILMKFNYGRLQVTGPTIAASKNDTGAFARAVEAEMKGILIDVKDKITSQLWASSAPGANDISGSLAAIVDDGTLVATFQAITRSSNTWWKAQMKTNSGTNRALTLALLQDAYTASEKNAADTNSLYIFTEYALRDKYLGLVVADKRFPNSMELDGGFKVLEYNGRPFVADPRAIANKIFIVDMSHVALYRMSGDFDWMDKDGAILSRVPNVDAYEATLFLYANVGADRCNVHTLLGDITNT